MNKRRLVLFSAAILLLAGCDKAVVIEKENVQLPEEQVAEPVPGIMMVKMDSELKELQHGPYTFKPAFKVGGKFEKRHREAGLHLWYQVRFDSEIPLTKASADLSTLDDVKVVERVPVAVQTRTFDDPHFSNQWSMFNDGVSYNKSQKILGSDVNVVKAWDVTTGDPSVIVAVCDGGVDYMHEDLHDNMWVNEAELNGAPGVDDDGNGEVDDIYGASFCTDGDGHDLHEIIPNDHGTHIAGVIAAKNNNGIGISGIAGGDGTPGTGVRIMSIQNSADSYPLGYFGLMFVYAADNGAVLMNCSWEFPDVEETPEFVKEAIDYFNTYAGLDENGNQVGPMAGGLAIFAAGNDNTTKAYPAMDDNVIAVSSIGADYVAAYYSNYGDWVDVAAPGGDAQKGYQIYSTYPENKYGNMQGTSMACPHAVGVAALIVSKYKGQGFTREKLIDILLKTSNPVIYDYQRKHIGKGLIDAYAAVSLGDNPPLKVEGISLTGVPGGFAYAFDKVKNQTGRYPESYVVFASEKSLASLDPENPGKDVHVSVYESPQSESAVEAEMGGLAFDTKYYVRIAARNAAGIFSPLSDEKTVATIANTPPVVTALDPTDIVLKSHETAEMRFTVSDKDKQAISYRLEGDFKGAAITKPSNEGVTVVINALEADEDTQYSGNLLVSDGIAEVPVPIRYYVKANTAPVVKSPIPNALFSALKESKTIDLSSYIVDEDGENLEYEVKASVANVVSVTSLTGSKLNLSSKSYGTTTFTVTATDARGCSVSAKFMLVVRDGSREVDIYPNPVTDYVYVRTGTAQNATVTIFNNAGGKVISLESQDIDAFNPLRVDMTSVLPGEYHVRVQSSEMDKSYAIVKK